VPALPDEDVVPLRKGRHAVVQVDDPRDGHQLVVARAKRVAQVACEARVDEEGVL
jgi:hypothetical protein